MPSRERPGRPFRRHAQAHLPPLTAHEARLVVAILERLLKAVWRAHGDELADLEACLGIETPRPPDAVWTSSPVDDNFEF